MLRQAGLLLVVAISLILVGVLWAYALLWLYGGTPWFRGAQTSTSGGGNPYEASASMASLRGAEWQVTDAPEEAPDPNAGVRLAGYLQTSAPDGEPIDLEFYENPEDAQAEQSEAMSEGLLGATAVENVLAYDVENEFGQVSPENLQALQTLLRGG